MRGPGSTVNYEQTGKSKLSLIVSLSPSFEQTPCFIQCITSPANRSAEMGTDTEAKSGSAASITPSIKGIIQEILDSLEGFARTNPRAATDFEGRLTSLLTTLRVYGTVVSKSLETKPMAYHKHIIEAIERVEHRSNDPASTVLNTTDRNRTQMRQLEAIRRVVQKAFVDLTAAIFPNKKGDCVEDGLKRDWCNEHGIKGHSVRCLNLRRVFSLVKLLTISRDPERGRDSLRAENAFDSQKQG